MVCRTLEALERLGAAAISPHMEVLIKLLEHKDSGVVCRTLGALERLGAAAISPHMEALIMLLVHKDSGVKSRTVCPAWCHTALYRR